jgi:hypothetical protein
MNVNDKIKITKGEYLAWQGIVTGVYGALCSVRLNYRGTVVMATLPQADVIVTESAEQDEDIYTDDYLKPFYDYYFNTD